MTAVDTLLNETIVVACAVASRRGADLAHSRLQLDDIGSHNLGQVFAATVDLPDFPMPTEDEALHWAVVRLAGDTPPAIWPSERRLQTLADRLGTPVADLEDLTERRPVATDETGVYAERVRQAAHQRRLRSAAIELLLCLEEPDIDTHHAARLVATLADQLEAR